MTADDANVRAVSPAREARYAEAITNSDGDTLGSRAIRAVARAVMAVADAERERDAATIAELRAEVERLRAEYLKGGSYWDARNDRQNAAIDRARMERAQAEDAQTEATARAEAAESALTEAREREARLREAVDEYDGILTRQGDLLTRTANALKGDPPERTAWSHHDVPELAQEAVALLAKVKALATEHDHCSGCPTPWWLRAALAPSTSPAEQEGDS